MKEFLHHLFLPHHTNNQRPKVLHHNSILYIIIFLLVGSFFLSTTKTTFSKVLGTSINIAINDLLTLTNQKRAENGELPLVLNQQLSTAASLKAHDMLVYDYWAHNSPQGKAPWDFIKDAGYDYIYAGENLARGFTNAKDVIDAWMASPTHRENILSQNYRDIGFALQKGDLTGEKDTVLIVEMFGSKTLASAPVRQETLPSATAKNEESFAPVTIKNNPLFDTSLLTRNISIFLLSLFIVILIIDIIIIQRRKVIRLVGHNLDHIMFLSVVMIVILFLQRGSIF